MSTGTRLLRLTTVPISLKLLLRGQLRFFMDEGFEVLAVSADGPEVIDLEREGIRHQIVPLTRVISPLRDLISLFRLVRVIRQFRPDIIHTHTPKAGLLGMLAAWICRVPVRLHTVAGLPLMEKKGLLRAILVLTEKITYKCATAVFPNSEGLRNFICSSIPTKTRLRMIGRGSSNGIDTRFFEASQALVSKGTEFKKTYDVYDHEAIFCFVGRIVGDKGINELLKAFDILSQEVPCRLFLAGPFEDELDPISQASRKILAENRQVICLGYVDDVRPLLLASDVFVFPSYREGFPNVVMQACCMGCASIVSDINGCNEIVRHGETGLIVKPKDVEGLIAAMRTLALDESMRKQFASRARAFVVENFDQEFVWQELLKEYRTLLAAEGLPLPQPATVTSS